MLHRCSHIIVQRSTPLTFKHEVIYIVKNADISHLPARVCCGAQSHVIVWYQLSGRAEACPSPPALISSMGNEVTLLLAQRQHQACLNLQSQVNQFTWPRSSYIYGKLLTVPNTIMTSTMVVYCSETDTWVWVWANRLAKRFNSSSFC